MHAFTDSAGRSWEVTVNVGAVKRVRDLLQADLMDVANGELLSRLADDPCLLVDVLFALVKPEADARGVPDEDFGRAMVGGVLDDAASALFKELLGFFPSAQRARALGRMVRKVEQQQAAMAEAAEMLKSLPDARTPGDSSGALPASAESSPTG
jgi:hypothetical protein